MLGFGWTPALLPRGGWGALAISSNVNVSRAAILSKTRSASAVDVAPIPAGHVSPPQALGLGRKATAVVWLRADLRIQDQLALAAAVEAGWTNLLAVFLVPQNDREESLGADPVDGRDLSIARAAFMVEALEDLQVGLQARGSDLLLIPYKDIGPGDLASRQAEALVAVCSVVDARAVYYHRGVTTFERTVETCFASSINNRIGAAESLSGEESFGIFPQWGNTVHDLPKIPIQNLPDDSDDFAKLLCGASIPGARNPVPASGRLPSPPSLGAKLNVVTFESFRERIYNSSTKGEHSRGPRGGEGQATILLEDFIASRSTLLQSTRPIEGPMHKLNQYLAWGCLSPRWVYHEITSRLPETSLRRHCAQYELLLRDFFRFSALKHGAYVA